MSLSNLVGGLASLLDDEKRPIPYDGFDTHELYINQDDYAIFDREEFDTWIEQLKTVLNQVEDLIDESQ